MLSEPSHIANQTANLSALPKYWPFGPRGYISLRSDIVALITTPPDILFCSRNIITKNH